MLLVSFIPLVAWSEEEEEDEEEEEEEEKCKDCFFVLECPLSLFRLGLYSEGAPAPFCADHRSGKAL